MLSKGGSKRLEEAYQNVEHINNSQEIPTPHYFGGNFDFSAFSEEASKDVFDFDNEMLIEREEEDLRVNTLAVPTKPNASPSFKKSDKKK